MKNLTRNFYLTLCLVIGAQQAYAQQSDTNPEGEPEFSVVEEKALPKGGMQGWAEYLRDNLRYPEEARRLGIEGKVYTQFVVGKDGSISNIEVFKGIGAPCDKEAIQVVKNAPTPWTPGTKNGKPVKVRMVVPIIF